MTLQITKGKKYKSEKSGQLVSYYFGIWINKTKWVGEKESFLCWIFINGPGYSFTEKKVFLD